MVIVDGNGLGSGLVDELLKETYDPVTDETYPCWNTINTDNQPETNDYDTCLFDMKAQTYQSKVISHFIDAVDSGKLRLLEKRKDSTFSPAEMDHYVEKVLPYVQTDFMFEEIANLKLKVLNNGNLTVEKTVAKLNKDRFSCLSYCIFYIMEFCNSNTYEDKSDLEVLQQYTYL